MSKSSPIPARAFWGNAAHTFGLVTEFLRLAQKAELRDKGHECGHQFRVTVESCGHSSGVVGDVPMVHSDANWWSDPSGPVVVRAHNLRDALLLAAAEPFGSWFPEEDE